MAKGFQKVETLAFKDVVIILISVLITVGSVTCRYLESKRESSKISKTHQERKSEGDFLYRLLQVLGVDNASQRQRHAAPPQYMVDLYNAVAGNGGITMTPNPYYANVIRSFSDKSSQHHLRFFFNVTYNVPKKERILEAEFHLFKLKPRMKAKERLRELSSHLLEVRVYQAMPAGEGGHRLLDVRRMSIHSTGWEVFYVRTAVMDWLRENNTNLGLLLSVRSLQGAPVPDGLVRFAKRHQHHINKQPILVLFIDDGRQTNRRYYPRTDFHDYGIQSVSSFSPEKINVHFDEKYLSRNLGESEQYTTAISRVKRSEDFEEAMNDGSNQRQSCTRHELYVDFEKIGWSTWIISPKGYNAFYCKGECAFPLGQNQLPTNHATVQSIVHELNLTPGVDTPCCVPNKLYSISLLYFDEHENVILKQYDDMVAASCGCH